MKFKASPFHYMLLFLTVSLSIPLLIASNPPEDIKVVLRLDDTEQLNYRIHIDRATVSQKALFWSYLLVTVFLLEYIINIALLYYPFSMRLSESSVRPSDDHRLFGLCDMAARKMRIKTPRIFLSKKPEIYVHGTSEDKATIVLYEGSLMMSDAELCSILTHEISHIKSDIQYNSLVHLFDKSHGKFSVFTGITFSIVCVWLFINLLQAVKVPMRSNLHERLVMFFNGVLPFFLAALALGLVMSTRFFVSFFGSALIRPVPEIDEFKADLKAFLAIGDADALIRSLETWRRLQLEYYLRYPSKGGSSLRGVREWYQRTMRKGFLAKEYSSWLEYFEESFVSIFFGFGRGFDLPKDMLRKQFVTFIDRLTNHHVSFRVNRKEIISLHRSWAIKTKLTNSEIALRQWLQDEVYHIPKEKKKEIINHLMAHTADFNVNECSSQTKTSAYEVIIVLLVLLIQNTISADEPSEHHS